MAKQKNMHGPGKQLLYLALGLAGLGVCITLMLTGTDIALLNPKGLIAGQQRDLIIFSVVLLLIVAVPTIVLLYFFAWKYRESNPKATYNPNTRNGKAYVFSIWAIPTIFMLVLALVMIPATHKLEPKKPIASNAKPLTIQVIAMRWKWLFIYPEQNIASVNFVQVPVGTPVEFEITADEAPMSSFWVPHWGGQIYAMTGHVNLLHLLAEQPGDYPGSSAEINGRGFAGMKFTARASSKESFDLWVNSVKNSSDALDTKEYENLLKPSEKNPTAFYSAAGKDLYAKMLMKYQGSHQHQPAGLGGGEH